MDAAIALALRFREKFGAIPKIFRAPGRVNLIGEHTDYNEGWVMPAAIQLATYVAIAPAPGRRITVHSENIPETVTFDLDDSGPLRRGHWSDYVRGVAVCIDRAAGPIPAANLLIRGGVPLGAGLSSSAALEVAAAFALLAHSGVSMNPAEIALLCQRAENEFAGVRCGVMDQFAACLARANHAMLLDCRSLEARQLAFPPEVRLAVCNTMVRHALAAGEYNRRREECEAGVRALSRFLPGLRALRDLTPDRLAEFCSAIDPLVFRRCRHVVTENARVLAAAEALERGDLGKLGKRMEASHISLRDDYQVSCEELNVMVDSASAMEGVYGARMMGGGFGGCALALVDAGRADAFARDISERYFQRTGIRGQVHICRAAEGAGEVRL
ncbi:MAG TPA: galactokinase [Bryobacteraceae bacterium]|nr:galactokinase [Bryobacteraceae bacterium]